MVTTPVDFDWSSAVEFAQRQYRISRLYLKRWWVLAVAAGTVTQAACWGQLYAALLVDSLAMWQRVALLTSSAGLIGITIYRAKVRQDLVEIYAPGSSDQLQRARMFDTLGAPVVAIVNLLVLFSSSMGRRIRWRGISYLVSSEGQSRLLGRRYETGEEGPVILKFPTANEQKETTQLPNKLRRAA